MPNDHGSILHLFIKKQHGIAMKEVEALNLKIGYGIEGDINANSISPRQVLVIRYEDIVDLAIPPGELRENIVLKGIKTQNFTPGSRLIFDSGAAIRLTFHCEPCKRIAHLVNSIKNIQYKRGILGVIINSGTIKIRDHVQIQTGYFPPLPENPYERFLNFLVKVPSGKIVTYKQIITAIGVDNSYLRAIPTYLKKTSATHYPIHRILDSQGYLIKYIANQKYQLESEGVEVLNNLDSWDNVKGYFVDTHKYLYSDEKLYLQ